MSASDFEADVDQQSDEEVLDIRSLVKGHGSQPPGRKRKEIPE